MTELVLNAQASSGNASAAHANVTGLVNTMAFRSRHKRGASGAKRWIAAGAVTGLAILLAATIAGAAAWPVVADHSVKPHFNQVWERIRYHDGFHDAHSNDGGAHYGQHAEYSAHIHDPNGYAVSSIPQYIYVPPCLSPTGEGEAVRLIPYYVPYPPASAPRAVGAPPETRTYPPVTYSSASGYPNRISGINENGDVTAQPFTATYCGQN